jgi:DNA-binding transcriptional ArsR family regulator
MSAETLDLVFQSLASRSRRRIIDILKQRPGANVNEVSQHFDTSRIAVMKHLAVLEEARLIVSEKVGRTRRLYFNAEPIQQICQRWTSEYGQLPDDHDKLFESSTPDDSRVPVIAAASDGRDGFTP